MAAKVKPTAMSFPSRAKTSATAVSTTTSPSATNTRNYFQAWSDNVAQGNSDLRSGRLNLRSPSLSLLSELNYVDLEPVMPFDPMFVNGRQTITLVGATMDYH